MEIYSKLGEVSFLLWQWHLRLDLDRAPLLHEGGNPTFFELLNQLVVSPVLVEQLVLVVGESAFKRRPQLVSHHWERLKRLLRLVLQRRVNRMVRLEGRGRDGI